MTTARKTSLRMGIEFITNGEGGSIIPDGTMMVRSGYAVHEKRIGSGEYVRSSRTVFCVFTDDELREIRRTIADELRRRAEVQRSPVRRGKAKMDA